MKSNPKVKPNIRNQNYSFESFDLRLNKQPESVSINLQQLQAERQSSFIKQKNTENEGLFKLKKIYKPITNGYGFTSHSYNLSQTRQKQVGFSRSISTYEPYIVKKCNVDKQQNYLETINRTRLKSQWFNKDIFDKEKDNNKLIKINQNQTSKSINRYKQNSSLYNPKQQQFINQNLKLKPEIDVNEASPQSSLIYQPKEPQKKQLETKSNKQFQNLTHFSFTAHQDLKNKIIQKYKQVILSKNQNNRHFSKQIEQNVVQSQTQDKVYNIFNQMIVKINYMEKQIKDLKDKNNKLTNQYLNEIKQINMEKQKTILQIQKNNYLKITELTVQNQSHLSTIKTLNEQKNHYLNLSQRQIINLKHQLFQYQMFLKAQRQIRESQGQNYQTIIAQIKSQYQAITNKLIKEKAQIVDSFQKKLQQNLQIQDNQKSTNSLKESPISSASEKINEVGSQNNLKRQGKKKILRDKDKTKIKKSQSSSNSIQILQNNSQKYVQINMNNQALKNQTNNCKSKKCQTQTSNQVNRLIVNVNSIQVIKQIDHQIMQELQYKNQLIYQMNGAIENYKETIQKLNEEIVNYENDIKQKMLYQKAYHYYGQVLQMFDIEWKQQNNQGKSSHQQLINSISLFTKRIEDLMKAINTLQLNLFNVTTQNINIKNQQQVILKKCQYMITNAEIENDSLIIRYHQANKSLNEAGQYLHILQKLIESSNQDFIKANLRQLGLKILLKSSKHQEFDESENINEYTNINQEQNKLEVINNRKQINYKDSQIRYCLTQTIDMNISEGCSKTNGQTKELQIQYQEKYDINFQLENSPSISVNYD